MKYLGILEIVFLFMNFVIGDTCHGQKLFQHDQDGFPLFGNDVVIQNEPSQDQRLIAITSAFNGWLYAVYGFRLGNYPALAILRSVDEGVTWTKLIGGPIISNNTEFTNLDIIVPGNSIADMKIILAGNYRVIGDVVGYGFVTLYDAQTGTAINKILDQSDCYHVAFASGSPFTSNITGPFSFGVIYSKLYYSSGDSVIFKSSSNGGASFDHYQAVDYAPWPFRFHKVALSYGDRTNGTNGQYFAVWERFANLNATRGHLYTSRTWPDVNGSFSSPKNLDSLDLTAVNQCNNPRIACQYGSLLNDSANFTEVILCNRYNTSTTDIDIIGFLNRQAADHNYFSKFDLATTLGNERTPDIAFNPYDSSFMVTYFDSVQKKLPFLVNNLNISNVGGWNMVTTGYNDNSNLSSPIPKVVCDPIRHSGVNAWISEGPGGNGIALYDSPSHFYTGTDIQPGYDQNELSFHVWPNPIEGSFNINFKLEMAERVKLSLKHLMGSEIRTLTDRHFDAGNQQVNIDISYLSGGVYFVLLETDHHYQIIKIIKL